MKRIVVPVLIAGAIAAGFYAGRISSACAGKEEDRPKASAESSGDAAKLAKAERRIAELERKHAAARTREFVDPVRIVATSHGLEGADILSAPKFGQVPEGRFLAGSGVVLSNDEWLVLDFGRELHGSLQIGSGAKGGRGAKVRVRFGESVSETMSELKGTADGATAMRFATTRCCFRGLAAAKSARRAFASSASKMQATARYSLNTSAPCR